MPSGLGKEESSKLNIASQLKAIIELNLLSFGLLQGISSKVKAILLEVNLSMGSQSGHSHDRDGAIIMCMLSGIRGVQVINYT
jgi:hypothetical protein